MTLFDTVEKTFRIRRSSRRLRAAFVEWRETHEGLDRFADLDDLVARCEQPEGRAGDLVDQALAALCVQAARGGRHETADDDAACLLLWILLEPLRRRSEDADIATPLDGDDAQAEIAAGMWERVVRIRPGNRAVAPALVNAGRRGARLAARAEFDYRTCCRKLFELKRTARALVDCGHPEAIVGEAVEAGVVKRSEAELIASTRLGGDSLGHAAAERGLNYSAARMRRIRAEASLVTWLEDTDASARLPAGAPSGLSPSGPQRVVSGLREQASARSASGHGKEVMPGRSDGLPNHISRRPDATKAAGCPGNAHEA